MLLILDPQATPETLEALRSGLARLGLSPHMAGEGGTAIGIVGTVSAKAKAELAKLPGVRKIVPVAEPYRLASRVFHPAPTLVNVGKAQVGGRQVVMMAGPCSVESREHILEMARLVKEAGIPVLRGGAYKPRTSPYAFQGLGEKGLEYLKEAGEKYDLATVSEVMDASQLPAMLETIDLLQVGARNMQNFTLLSALGKVRRPVLLKRGLSATLQEWLMSAEYIMAGGNDQVILCERGIRTFEPATRNTFDVSCIPVLREMTHLPIVVDPSHAIGVRDKVIPLARAGVAAGADGVIVEFHTCPEEALSDGPQALYPEQLDQLVRELEGIAQVIGRGMNR
ncbi:3-deoxy-7-phosphoheptulonate synthase [Holophaga foetida]|uniref:3-deoxy-7-phosphoheptulonate synthase n=1 Tax=Holophaga foetida TaxID=35839 RepID=UPI000247461F|nr:3-deoxy-7-phosphoheptulonate synthase [Holophaga foetida]